VLDARLTSVTVVLENTYDPHNAAAALRSVEAFGLSDLHVVQDRSSFQPSRAITIGADLWVDVHEYRSFDNCESGLRDSGMKLCGTVPDAEARIADLDCSQHWAIVCGNERDGLTPRALDACDVHVSIPMYGFSQSINLSVFVALAVSQLASRRRESLAALGDLSDKKRARLRARWYAQGVRGFADIIRRHTRA